MPIDVEKAVGHSAPIGTHGWTPHDVILYHLGLGAAQDDLAADLRYVYERDLVVLPSICTTVFPSGLAPLLAVPGMDFDPTQLLHAEQEIVINRPLTPSGTVEGTHTIPAIHDKGKAALVESQVIGTDPDGDVRFTSTAAVFIRGEGGWGGDPGPRATDHTPQRDPDVVLERPTTIQQPALYRLNGDDNALHIDPEFAAKAGFDQPILHGLCFYGMALKAAVDALLDGDPSRVTRYAVRFAGVVFPGETLRVSLWRGDGTINLTADVIERDAPALTRGVIDHR